MAQQARLTYSGTSVTFGIGPGYEEPRDPDRIHLKAADKTLHSYDFNTPARKWKVPIMNITKTDADNLNSWWLNRYDLTWIPDYTGASGTTYTVRIMNIDQPMWFRFLAHWEENYSGSLLLQETS